MPLLSHMIFLVIISLSYSPGGWSSLYRGHHRGKSEVKVSGMPGNTDVDDAPGWRFFWSWGYNEDIMRIYDQKWGLHGIYIYIYMMFCEFLGLWVGLAAGKLRSKLFHSNVRRTVWPTEHGVWTKMRVEPRASSKIKNVPVSVVDFSGWISS